MIITWQSAQGGLSCTRWQGFLLPPWKFNLHEQFEQNDWKYSRGTTNYYKSCYHLINLFKITQNSILSLVNLPEV